MRIALGLALALAAAAARAGPPHAVVLVTIDTLRADHLGSYGYERPTSPFLDRLAREGVLFEQAFAAGSHTTPAHVSLFTGLYASQHGVRHNGQGIPEKAGYRTLAERFAEAGYDAAAFSSVGFLRPIARGFGSVDTAPDGGRQGRRTADATIAQALAWVAKKKPADRFFLWVHLYDPHIPRRAPADCRQRLAFPSREQAEAFGRRMLEARGIPPKFYGTPAALADAFALYDAEIFFADRELDRLHAGMEAAGLNKDALWVVTADHGEGMGSHNYGGHGNFIYQEQLRVPLVMWGRGAPAGVRIKGLVRHVDVLPTLLELLGRRPEQPGYELPGRSLASLLRDPSRALPPVLAFAQRRPPHLDPGREPAEMFALHDLDWKYIAHAKGEDEFFDLRTDPLELRSLRGAAPPVAERLGALARETLLRLEREGQRVGPVPMDPATEQELRALGYIR